MNNRELAEAFVEADKQGFLGNDIEDASACNDECSSCPASPACRQMSNNGHGGQSYTQFKELYHKEVLPIIKEIQNETR